MKSKIEAYRNYECEVFNNPIKLIIAIKEHALSYKESRYEMNIIMDVYLAYFNCLQKDKDSLQDYTRIFEVARDILKLQLGGDIVLPKFIKGMTGYDETDYTEVAELAKLANEQLTTYLYLVNSDQDKYGSVIKGLHSQKALNNNQYPNNMIEGNNVLITHRLDNLKKEERFQE